MSEYWVESQEKEYNEMYEKYYRAKELADKVFDLIKDKDFGEADIKQDTQAQFDSLMGQIDGIEEYFYNELSKLMNENYSKDEIEKLTDKAVVDRLKGNNARFGYLLGNYMLDGKFNDKLVEVIWSDRTIALNYLFYNMIAGDEYQQSNFCRCINQYKELISMMYYDLSRLYVDNEINSNEIKQQYYGCVLFFEIKKTENQLDINYIYNLIREKGFDIEDFIHRYNLAKSYVTEFNAKPENANAQYPSIDFADDIVKKFADLDKMFCLASIYDANKQPEAKDVRNAIANVYASLQSLNYDEMISADLKNLVQDEIDKTSSNKADVKKFFESFIFGKDIEPDIEVDPINLAEYMSTYGKFPSGVFNLLDIKEENLLNWLSNRVNEDNGEDGFEEQKSYFEEDMKRIKQLHGEIFGFVEKDNQQKNIQNAKEKFLRSPLFNIAKLNDYISLCKKFDLADNLKAARSLRQWIIQNKLRGRVEDTFIAYAEKKFNEECEKSVDPRVNDRENKIAKLARFKKIVFRNCSTRLYKKFTQMDLNYVSPFEPDAYYRIQLIGMLKNGNGIDGVLDHLSKNPQDTQAIVFCMIYNPSLFFNNNFAWEAKVKITHANAKNKNMASEEYERYTVRNLISAHSELTKEEIAVAFRLSEKTYWWNRNKNLQRLLTKVNGKSGFKIIAEVVAKLSPDQEDKFYDWLYTNRDELITENGVIENLFERAQNNGILTKEQEELIRLVPAEKQDRFREYFKDPDFREVVQTGAAMKNMLLVDEFCCVDPVEYLAECKKNNSLANIKLAFEKFSVDKVKSYYQDSIKDFSDKTLGAWLCQFLNDFIFHAGYLIKEKDKYSFTDNEIDSILDDCQFVTNDDSRDVSFNFLMQLAHDKRLQNMHDRLFSKEFLDNIVSLKCDYDGIIEKGHELLNLTIEQNNFIDFAGLYHYVSDHKHGIIVIFLNANALANVIFESKYGDKLYCGLISGLKDISEQEKQRVERYVIKFKNNKIREAFGEDKDKYNEFVKMIAGDKRHLIGKFISKDTDLNLLYDVIQAGMDLNKINGVDLSAMQKMFEQNPNDKDKMLKSFVSYAKGREQGDVAILIYCLSNAQELINGQKIHPNKQWVRWAKYMADAVIFEIENNVAELGKYVKLLDREDLPEELKKELKSRPQVKMDVAVDLIAAAIESSGTYNVDDIPDLPSDTDELARGVAQKLKSLPNKSAADLADIVNALYATDGILAGQIAANLNMIPEVAQQLRSELEQGDVEKSVR